MLPASRYSVNPLIIANRQCCRFRAPLAASSATLPFGKTAYKVDKIASTRQIANRQCCLLEGMQSLLNIIAFWQCCRYRTRWCRAVVWVFPISTDH